MSSKDFLACCSVMPKGITDPYLFLLSIYRYANITLSSLFPRVGYGTQGFMYARPVLK